MCGTRREGGRKEGREGGSALARHKTTSPSSARPISAFLCLISATNQDNLRCKDFDISTNAILDPISSCAELITHNIAAIALQRQESLCN
jgi:hypothetical protein